MTTKAANRKKKERLTSGVYVSASLKFGNFNGADDLDGWLEECHVNSDGYLVGTGSCGNENFICTKAEIPKLIDFLQKIVAAK